MGKIEIIEEDGKFYLRGTPKEGPSVWMMSDSGRVEFPSEESARGYLKAMGWE